MGLRGLLRAISTAVFGESRISLSPAEKVLFRASQLLSKLPLLITVSFKRTVSPTIRLVTLLGWDDVSGSKGSVWMAVSVRSELGLRDELSSVEMHTSTISEPNGGGNMT